MENVGVHDNRKRKQILLHVSIWAVFICFNLMQPRVQTEDMVNRIVLVLIGNMALFYINYSYLVTHFLLKKKILLYTILVLSLVILSTVMFYRFSPEFRPLDNFKPPFPKNRPEHFFPVKLIGPFIFNVLLMTTGTAFRVYGEWNRNERKKKEIEVQKFTNS